MHLTSPGQKHEGKEVKFLALQGAFMVVQTAPRSYQTRLLENIKSISTRSTRGQIL